jgi:hypothetical protein
MEKLIDAYLAKDSLSICLPDRFDEDKRFKFNHPERIITVENFEEIARELHPYFLLSVPSRKSLIWDRGEIVGAISCALYLHYVKCLHQADIDDRETAMQ